MTATVATFVLCGIVGFFAPWWSIAPVAFCVGLWQRTSGWKAFISGFVGVGSLWLVAAAYVHFQSQGILSARIAAMMGLPWPFSLVLLTALIGGLVGGLAAASGAIAPRKFK